ncbi:MAG: hypothetical protein DRN40_03990 [Thermoplasmata archaeon]|nr:MAG: hypothetical protein DRN40_03990 [Thermoplasmata archaeon]
MIYVQTGGERIIYLGGDKRREIEEVFDIGDLLRLIHGGYDVRVNVTDINGNWATGKTHIDSALQTLKKGLSALLDMIVAALKVIAKVASMLLDVIKKIIMNMLKPIIEPIKRKVRNIIYKIYDALYQLFITAFPESDDYNTRETGIPGIDYAIAHLYNVSMSALFYITFLFWQSIQLLEFIIRNSYPVGLTIFTVVLGGIMFGLLYGIVGSLYIPQKKPYKTYVDRLDSIPELIVDKIPSNKWWTARAPIVLLTLMKTLSIELTILSGEMKLTRSTKLGIFLSIVGGIIFAGAGAGIVPSVFAASCGLIFASLGLAIMVVSSIKEFSKYPISTTTGILFSTALFLVSLANLLRQC